MWLAAGAVLCPTPSRAQAVVVPVAEDRTKAVECMTLAVAYEAGYETLEGKQAVAEVVLNRVRNPVFPKSVCGVVFAGSTRPTGCQFSFTCDGSLRRRLPHSVMLAARAVAEQAIDGQGPSLVFGATHYHADYVTPYWSSSLVRLTKIGPHIFYRIPGSNAGPIPGAIVVAASDASSIGAAGGEATAVAAPAPPAAFAPWGLTLAPAGAP